MFGFRFIRFQPSEYVLVYKNGKVVREGQGLAFRYYAPRTAIVMLPLSSIDCPFVFSEATSDFQTVTIQGQATFRIVDQKKVATLLNFTVRVGQNGVPAYVSDDPQKLSQRVGNIIRVLTKKHIESLTMVDSIRASEKLAQLILTDIRQNEEIIELGIEIMGLSVLSVQPTKDTAHALEAETREKILKRADDAIYVRRNASIEQERGVKENEYNTEIAVENKRRQVRETQLATEQAEMQKKHELEVEQLAFQIAQEEKRKTLVAIEAENTRAQADAKAYELKAMVDVFMGLDTEVIRALASVNMKPATLIANAFSSLAESTDKIGQLNISPDLLREVSSHE